MNHAVEAAEAFYSCRDGRFHICAHCDVATDRERVTAPLDDLVGDDITGRGTARGDDDVSSVLGARKRYSGSYSAAGPGDQHGASAQ